MRLWIRFPGEKSLLVDQGPWTSLTVGSALECDLPVRARYVSRRHVELARSGEEVRFRDLGSSNGTFLNGSRAEAGVLGSGDVLGVGEAAIHLADSATEAFPAGGAGPDVRVTALAELGGGGEDPEGRGSESRLYGLDEVASLLGTFLAEGRTGQEWSHACRFLRGALRARGVLCYAWEGESLCLSGTSGRFPEETLLRSQREALCALPKVASAEAASPSGPVRISCLPVAAAGRRVVFLALHEEGADPLLRHQEILPVVYVVCRLVVEWSEELRARDVRVGELQERVRAVEANLVASADGAEPLVGRSPVLVEEIRSADKAAPTEASVLLVGPTGSGKELFARRIHRLSKRAAGPFVAINCASIPETLLESELFGVSRGAYTGADRNRAGFFERAASGTLFLDEVSDLPAGLQPKLLRVLEEKQVVPLGGARPVKVDVRVVAATNRDPSSLIREGRFREDLYFRLAQVVLRVPPLAERGDDLVLLAHYFLQVANREYQKSVQGFDERALTVLRRYSWPGNVRQVQSLVKQAVLLGDGPVITEDQVAALLKRFHDGRPLPAAAPWSEPWAEACERFEEEYFRTRLARHRGSLTDLAKEIGMTRPNLYLKMRKWGLKPGEGRS
ncbi:MAG: sigma 54-interacting transcriptional regulator [Acidobacteriota bacterium]